MGASMIDAHQQMRSQETYVSKKNPTYLQKSRTYLQKRPGDTYRYLVPMCTGSIYNRCTTTDANNKTELIRIRTQHLAREPNISPKSPTFRTRAPYFAKQIHISQKSSTFCKRAPHFHICRWQCSTHQLSPHTNDSFPYMSKLCLVCLSHKRMNRVPRMSDSYPLSSHKEWVISKTIGKLCLIDPSHKRMGHVPRESESCLMCCAHKRKTHVPNMSNSYSMYRLHTRMSRVQRMSVSCLIHQQVMSHMSSHESCHIFRVTSHVTYVESCLMSDTRTSHVTYVWASHVT